MITIKGIKTFQGHEDEGFNATLHINGKKAASVINEGNGGACYWRWEPGADKATWEAHVAGQPPWDCNGKMVPTDADLTIALLIEGEKYKRDCRKGILFILEDSPNECRVLGYRKRVPTDMLAKVREQVVAKHGDKILEIINDRFGPEFGGKA